MMGFFSSKKQTAAVSTEPSTALANSSASVAHVIKSKLYGGRKGKQREDPPLLGETNSTAPSLVHSHSQPIIGRADTIASSFARKNNASTNNNTISSSGSKRPTSIHIQTTGYKPSSGSNSSSSYFSRAPASASSAKQTHSPQKQHPPPLPRKQTDAVTVSLAQRLNDLATANSQGLLDDNEYRVLRQDLFERMAGASPLPTEVPIVPTMSSTKRPGAASAPTTPAAKTSSQFHVDPDVVSNRSQSIYSKTSIKSSGMASFLFRNASTSKGASSSSKNDSSARSISSRTGHHQQPSQASNMEGYKKSRLSRIFSSSSSSLAVSDAGMSAEGSELAGSIGGGSKSIRLRPNRSTPSMRHLGSPPSSYAPSVGRYHHSSQHSRSQTGNSQTSSSTVDYDAVNLSGASLQASLALLEDNPSADMENQPSSQEIRDVMRAVEAECRRLMDTFNGLELSILTKKQYQMPNLDGIGDGSNWTMSTTPPSTAGRHRTHHQKDTDSLSIRSHGTTSSIYSTLPAGSTRRMRTHGGESVSISMGFNPATGSRAPSRAGSINGIGHPQLPLPNQVTNSPLASRPGSLRKRSNSSLRSAAAASGVTSSYPLTPGSTVVRALPPVPGVSGASMLPPKSAPPGQTSMERGMRRKISNASMNSNSNPQSAATIPTLPPVPPVPPPPLIVDPKLLGTSAGPTSAHSAPETRTCASPSSAGVRILPPLPIPPPPPLPSHQHSGSSVHLMSRPSRSPSVSRSTSAAHLPMPVLEEVEVVDLCTTGTPATSSSMDDSPEIPAKQYNSAEHARSPSRATTTHTNDSSFVGADGQMDIRRKRAEVMAKYEERLEYLRAKLKGAELREKLMRR